MPFTIRLGSWLLALGLTCNGHAFTPAPPAPAASTVRQSIDESALRALAEAFFKNWAAKDLDGWLRLWTSHAPELEARKKAMTELFANSARIALNSFAIRRVGVVGGKAWVRVELDAQVIDAQTGKEVAGYGKSQRTLACVRAPEGWKVAREIASFDALAEEMVAAQDDQERSAMLESLDDRTAMATTLNKVGRLYRQRAKYELALSFLQRARDLGETAEARDQMCVALQQMGDVRRSMGQYDEAFEAYRQSLAVAEAMKDRGTMSELRGKLAVLHTLLGRYDNALTEIEQSLSIAKELDDGYLLAMNLTRKGSIYGESGRYAQATEIFQQALALGEKINSTIVMDSCLANLGII